MPVRIDTIAVTIAPPADGPSFGVAPSGRWMCRSVFVIEVRRDAELLRAMAHDRQRRGDRLVHHVAELAGRRRLALAGQRHRFDRQQVAADFGPCEARDLADLVLLLGDAVREAAHAEVLVEVLRVDVDRALGLARLAFALLAAAAP